MKARNRLLEVSFDYRYNISGRDLLDCIVSTGEVYLYVSLIGERLYFNTEELYIQEIMEGITLADWLWSNPWESDNKEYRDMLLQVLTKPAGKQEAAFSCDIDICFYPDGSNVSTKEQYVDERRGLLSSVTDKGEFCEFMPSCFINCIYSTQIRSGLNSISSFETTTVEIVKNLSVLNDEALDNYWKHKSNLLEAYKVLSSRLLECSPDAKHAQYLQFEFIDDDGNNVFVECSPHVKLTRKDSDLRIYFYWRHDNIGRGQKILIGRIGTHPY